MLRSRLCCCRIWSRQGSGAHSTGESPSRCKPPSTRTTTYHHDHHIIIAPFFKERILYFITERGPFILQKGVSFCLQKGARGWGFRWKGWRWREGSQERAWNRFYPARIGRSHRRDSEVVIRAEPRRNTLHSTGWFRRVFFGRGVLLRLEDCGAMRHSWGVVGETGLVEGVMWDVGGGGWGRFDFSGDAGGSIYAGHRRRLLVE